MFDAKKLLDLLVQSGSQLAANAQNTGAQAATSQGFGGMLGQVGAMVGQVMNQAQSGTVQGAQEIDQATGASQKAGDFLTQMTGSSPMDLLNKAKSLASGNMLATGAAVGGLAAILLGTGAGRAVIGSAARMGGMALVGGLAYKALQNYQAGKPLLDTEAAAETIEPAPASEETGSNDHAMRLVRAMIAAASADGVVDDTERAAILGNLKNAGLDDDAAGFIEGELANPADVATLAEGIEGQDAAAQVYAAARLAIDPDTDEETEFLASLASALALEEGLVAHIDAAASSAKA